MKVKLTSYSYRGVIDFAIQDEGIQEAKQVWLAEKNQLALFIAVHKAFTRFLKRAKRDKVSDAECDEAATDFLMLVAYQQLGLGDVGIVRQPPSVDLLAADARNPDGIDVSALEVV